MDNQLDIFNERSSNSFAEEFNAKNVLKIKGLIYIPDYITSSEEKVLLQNIDSSIWLDDLKRRVQHYGYKYDYRARRIDVSMKIGNLPPWGSAIANKLYSDSYFDYVPDQLIINEYMPGQGITSHIDCEPCFEDTIASISLGSDCIMEFTNDLTKEVVPIILEKRSLVILKGESRYNWKHGIPIRKKDLVDLTVINRTRRVSLTFRKVKLND